MWSVCKYLILNYVLFNSDKPEPVIINSVENCSKPNGEDFFVTQAGCDICLPPSGNISFVAVTCAVSPRNGTGPVTCKWLFEGKSIEPISEDSAKIVEYPSESSSVLVLGGNLLTLVDSTFLCQCTGQVGLATASSKIIFCD